MAAAAPLVKIMRTQTFSQYILNGRSRYRRKNYLSINKLDKLYCVVKCKKCLNIKKYPALDYHTNKL
ncbi:hypothetical protein MXB_112 [Myxobolus squamalis]|nr:hypothetical protein MXB_112 [Myxobolus squamalis]